MQENYQKPRKNQDRINNFLVQKSNNLSRYYQFILILIYDYINFSIVS
jgi:hypothetical protein